MQGHPPKDKQKRKLNLADQGDIVRFAERLKSLIGEESILSFARKVGISEGAIRKYLNAISEPSRINLIKIAQKTGVSVEWLATGQGPSSPSEQKPPSNPNGLDKAIVREVVEETESLLREYGIELEPSKKAELIVLLSEEVQEEKSKIPRDKILRLIKLAA